MTEVMWDKISTYLDSKYLYFNNDHSILALTFDFQIINASLYKILTIYGHCDLVRFDAILFQFMMK